MGLLEVPNPNLNASLLQAVRLPPKLLMALLKIHMVVFLEISPVNLLEVPRQALDASLLQVVHLFPGLLLVLLKMPLVVLLGIQHNQCWP